jgi:hypothetical protein
MHASRIFELPATWFPTAYDQGGELELRSLMKLKPDESGYLALAPILYPPGKVGNNKYLF